MPEHHFCGIRACVFDAYGTLFDVHSAVARHRERIGSRADAVSAAWRAKQLEYTWQRSLMDRYVDFWRVTADSLDYALEAQGIDDPSLRSDLLHAYLALDCYPEVPGVLRALREAGLRNAILSNGSPMMLEAAVESAGIGDLLDAVISVDSLGVYKPAMAVLSACPRPASGGARTGQLSVFHAWDAAAAATFGFRVVWCNRFAQPSERLPDAPHAEMRTLEGLPDIVLGRHGAR